MTHCREEDSDDDEDAEEEHRRKQQKKIAPTDDEDAACFAYSEMLNMERYDELRQYRFVKAFKKYKNAH